MAFYDANLRAIQIAARESIELVAYMVKRLTREPAEFFDLDAGTIEVGDHADIVLIDPDKLSSYDAEKTTCSVYREGFEHHQLVNRSTGIVPIVMIAGEIVWEEDAFTDALGKKKLGRALRRASAAAECVEYPERAAAE